MNTDRKIGKVLGELQSEVMEVIWQSQDPVSVKTVTQSLQEKRTIAYTTVMTVMGRLVDKGLLKRKESGKAYIYQPTHSKEKFLTRVSRQIIRNFASTFGEPAITHFAEEVDKLAPEKKKELVKLLKEAKKR